MAARLKPGEVRDTCGCVSNDRAWVFQCATHATEFNETHTRWAAELRARRPVQEGQDAQVQGC